MALLNWLNSANANGFEIQNVRLQNLAVAPATHLTAGRIYFDTGSGVNRIRWHDGTGFNDIYKFDTAATPNTAVLRDGSGAIAGAVVGVATSAAKWDAARTITLAGELSGSVAIDGSANVTLTATIANGTVTLAKMASVVTASFLGRVTAGTGAPEVLTTTQARNLLISAGTGVAIDGSGSISIGQAVGTSANVTFGAVTTGNLTVNGTLTTVNSETVTLDDPILTLGGDTAPTVDDNKDRGVNFRWHNGSVAKNGFFGFDRSSQKFLFVPDATLTAEVATGTKGTLDAFLEWADVLSKPSPAVTFTLGGVLTGSASATLTALASGSATLTAALAANAVGTSAIANNAVTLAKIETIATKRVVGNGTAGTAAPTALKIYHSQDVGGATSVAVTHGIGQRFIIPVCINNTTGDVEYPGFTCTDVNTLTVTFGVAPAANAYKIVCLGM